MNSAEEQQVRDALDDVETKLRYSKLSLEFYRTEVALHGKKDDPLGIRLEAHNALELYRKLMEHDNLLSKAKLLEALLTGPKEG